MKPLLRRLISMTGVQLSDSCRAALDADERPAEFEFLTDDINSIEPVVKRTHLSMRSLGRMHMALAKVSGCFTLHERTFGVYNAAHALLCTILRCHSLGYELYRDCTDNSVRLRGSVSTAQSLYSVRLCDHCMDSFDKHSMWLHYFSVCTLTITTSNCHPALCCVCAGDASEWQPTRLACRPETAGAC
jgi:hypothetical protein